MLNVRDPGDLAAGGQLLALLQAALIEPARRTLRVAVLLLVELVGGWWSWVVGRGSLGVGCWLLVGGPWSLIGGPW